MSNAGLTTIESNNFLALEQDIKAHLKNALKDVQPRLHVLCHADLKSIQQIRQFVPAVHVVYDGYSVTDSRAGYGATLEHRWNIVAAARNVANQRSGAAARIDAAQIVVAVGDAMLQFNPPRGFDKFKMITPSRPSYADGVAFIPLAFSVTTAFKRTQT